MEDKIPAATAAANNERKQGLMAWIVIVAVVYYEAPTAATTISIWIVVKTLQGIFYAVVVLLGILLLPVAV